MDTIANGRRSNGSNVVVLESRRQILFTQEDLLEERMLTHEAEEVIRRRDKKRELLRFGLMHGAKIEPGPLKAEMRPRFNRRYAKRRLHDEKSYSVLVVYV
jgi:hypothetical protein